MPWPKPRRPRRTEQSGELARAQQPNGSVHKPGKPAERPLGTASTGGTAPCRAAPLSGRNNTTRSRDTANTGELSGSPATVTVQRTAGDRSCGAGRNPRAATTSDEIAEPAQDPAEEAGGTRAVAVVAPPPSCATCATLRVTTHSLETSMQCRADKTYGHRDTERRCPSADADGQRPLSCQTAPVPPGTAVPGPSARGLALPLVRTRADPLEEELDLRAATDRAHRSAAHVSSLRVNREGTKRS